MPREYDFGALFGSQQYKDFGYIDAKQSLRVVYPLATQKFPIGYIIDRNTPADLGREVIDKTLQCDFGFVYHVSLAHQDHNIAKAIDWQKKHIQRVAMSKRKWSDTFSCDGLMIKRDGHPFVVETFLGDCACIVVFGKDHVGYMHAGRPEIMAEPSSVIENFFALWPENPEETFVWVGPCISGDHYEMQTIPEKFSKYETETVWFTKGFSLDVAIFDQICQYGKIEDSQIRLSSIDPFAINESGDHSWAASDQWYRRKGRELGVPIFSPRNSAILFVEG